MKLAGGGCMVGIPGFDISVYPGDSVMSWLKDNTNLAWAGYYLGPAPSHPHSDWMEKRSWLNSEGWGLAPIYVGQEQDTGPGSHILTEDQGIADGRQAAMLMRQAGFPIGSCVYLDVEDGSPIIPSQVAYISAWVDAIISTDFSPGIYCSHSVADQIHTARAQARIWAFHVQTTNEHAVPGTNFPNLDPSGCGYAGAFAWQIEQACLIDCPIAPLQKLLVDLSTAVTADPSS